MLFDAATSNGLAEKYGADTVQHICANALDGRTSGLKISPQSQIPIDGMMQDWRSRRRSLRRTAESTEEAKAGRHPDRVCANCRTFSRA